MANVNAPTGFKPLCKNDGSAYTGALTSYQIANAYNTNIFLGDAVKFLTTGVIAVAAAGDQIRGIFMGCEYLDSTGKLIKSPYWPASTALFGSSSKNAWAKVIDDPNMLFECQMNAAPNGQTDCGALFDLTASVAGSTGSGLSGQQIDVSTLATSTKVFRLIRFLERADNDTASIYCRGVYAPALHDFRVNTGI